MRELLKKIFICPKCHKRLIPDSEYFGFWTCGCDKNNSMMWICLSGKWYVWKNMWSFVDGKDAKKKQCLYSGDITERCCRCGSKNATINMCYSEDYKRRFYCCNKCYEIWDELWESYRAKHKLDICNFNSEWRKMFFMRFLKKKNSAEPFIFR